jgi:hypothetical protein
MVHLLDPDIMGTLGKFYLLIILHEYERYESPDPITAAIICQGRDV